MTKLSRQQLNPNDFSHYINNLWLAFTLMDSKGDIRLLFKDLFTHTEYKMFAKRLEIARRLLNGQTYNDIKVALRVTPTTIAKINNILAERGDGFKKVYVKFKKLEDKVQTRLKERQTYLEHQKRKKLVGETVVFDLLKEASQAVHQRVHKAIRNKSTKRELTL